MLEQGLNQDEEEWQARLLKRRSVVARVKSSEVYQTWLEHGFLTRVITLAKHDEEFVGTSAAGDELCRIPEVNVPTVLALRKEMAKVFEAEVHYFRIFDNVGSILDESAVPSGNGLTVQQKIASAQRWGRGIRSPVTPDPASRNVGKRQWE